MIFDGSGIIGFAIGYALKLINVAFKGLGLLLALITYLEYTRRYPLYRVLNYIGNRSSNANSISLNDYED
jgi:hypothetical protein